MELCKAIGPLQRVFELAEIKRCVPSDWKSSHCNGDLHGRLKQNWTGEWISLLLSVFALLLPRYLLTLNQQEFTLRWLAGTIPVLVLEGEEIASSLKWDTSSFLAWLANNMPCVRPNFFFYTKVFQLNFIQLIPTLFPTLIIYLSLNTSWLYTLHFLFNDCEIQKGASVTFM